MRRFWLVAALCMCLTGCGAQETFETIGNLQETPVQAQPLQIGVDLPGELSCAASMQEQTGGLYICDDYTVTTQILEGGDINATFRSCTGFDMKTIQVVQTQEGDMCRYDGVWTCVSESGDQVGRISVLDDGTYHYVLTAMTDAENAGMLSETWQGMFRSFRVEAPEDVIRSGS